MSNNKSLKLKQSINKLFALKQLEKEWVINTYKPVWYIIKINIKKDQEERDCLNR